MPLVDIIHISIKSVVLSVPTPPAPVSASIDAKQGKRRDGENAFIVVALTHPERWMIRAEGFLEGLWELV